MVLEFYTSVIFNVATIVLTTKKMHKCALCMHTFTNLPVTMHFFISAIWNATQRLCEATICFSVYKRWQQQDMKVKRSAHARVCDMHACAHNEFHKNPLCWVSSPLGCDAVLTFQSILLPLKDQQPLVQQQSITFQRAWILSSTAERTSYIATHFVLWNTSHTCIQHSRGTEQLAPVSSCRQQSPHLVSPCLVVPPAGGQTRSHTRHTSLFHLAWQCCRHQESIIEVLYASTVAIFSVWQISTCAWLMQEIQS